MKKAIALVLALMLTFALCACGGSGSSTTDSSASKTDSSAVTDVTKEVETTKAPSGIEGSWVMESYDSGTQMPVGATFEVAMEITADSFTYDEKDNIEGQESEFKMEGVCTIDGNTAKFSAKHSVAKFSSQSSETEIENPADFTGTLENEKLTLNIENNGIKTVIVLKRA